MACSVVSATSSDKYDDAVQDYSTVHGCYMPVLDPGREVPLLTAQIRGASDTVVYDPRVHVNFFKACPVFACTDFHFISRDYFIRMIEQPVGLAEKTRFYLYLPDKNAEASVWLWCSLERVSKKSSQSTGGYGEAVSNDDWQVRVLGRDMHIVGWQKWSAKVASKRGFDAVCSTNNPSAVQEGLSVCMKTKMTDLAKTASLGTLVVVWPISVDRPKSLAGRDKHTRHRTVHMAAAANLT